jgi:hypothetical protein
MKLSDPFSPGNDLFETADDVVPVVVTDASDHPLAVNVRGFKRTLSDADVSLSGGSFLPTDVWWHLCCDDCVAMLAANQRIAAPDGTRWQILTAPQMATCQTRWKCTCREL